MSNDNLYHKLRSPKNDRLNITSLETISEQHIQKELSNLLEDSVACYILSKEYEKEKKFGAVHYYKSKAFKYFKSILNIDPTFIDKQYNLLNKTNERIEIPKKPLFSDIELIIEKLYDSWRVAAWDYENDGLSPAYKEMVSNYKKRNRIE